MSHQVSHSAKDIFDLTSSPEDSPRLHTPVRVHQSSKYLQRNHLCRNILLFLRVKNFKMQVSNFFYFACDQSWGECHYTNAVLLSNKGSATRGGKLWTAKNTDLKIMDCPALQPYSSFFLFFLNILLLILPPKQQGIMCYLQRHSDYININRSTHTVSGILKQF